jgi:micrococcal nuclease
MLCPRTARCRRALLLLVLASFAGCDSVVDQSVRMPRERIAARVTKHTDGDTLWLSGIGKVRLIGVDTPEVYGDDECYGREASDFVERLVPLGAAVSYRLGIDERDRYGRALAYLYLDDGRLLNLLLVQRGYAQALTIPPNVELAQRFRRAARRARAAGRGLWGAAGCAR